MNDAEAKDSKIEKWQAKYLYADEIPWIGTSPAMDVMLLRAATARSHAERATEHAQALRPQSTPLSGADLAHAQRVAAAYAAGAFDLGLDAGTPEASCAHVWAPWPASTRPFPLVKCALCRSTMRSWPDMPAAAQPTQGAWTPEPWRSAWDDPPDEVSKAGEGPIIYSTKLGLDAGEFGDGRMVVHASWHDGPLTACTRENAARIVACVNACAGIPEPAAEIARLAAYDAMHHQMAADGKLQLDANGHVVFAAERDAAPAGDARIAKCVNALAGVPEPEAALKAIREYIAIFDETIDEFPEDGVAYMEQQSARIEASFNRLRVALGMPPKPGWTREDDEGRASVPPPPILCLCFVGDDAPELHELDHDKPRSVRSRALRSGRLGASRCEPAGHRTQS